MTYSHLVLAVWIIALGGTIGGLVVALRSLARAETALRRVRTAQEGVDVLEGATEALEVAVTDTAHARVRFHTRSTG